MIGEAQTKKTAGVGLHSVFFAAKTTTVGLAVNQRLGKFNPGVNREPDCRFLSLRRGPFDPNRERQIGAVAIPRASPTAG